MVQSLVNTYDYSGGEMVFYQTMPGVVSGMYGFLYMKEKGTGANSAQLVIDFEAPPTPGRGPDKTSYRYG